MKPTPRRFGMLVAIATVVGIIWWQVDVGDVQVGFCDGLGTFIYVALATLVMGAVGVLAGITFLIRGPRPRVWPVVRIGTIWILGLYAAALLAIILGPVVQEMRNGRDHTTGDCLG